MNAVIPGFGVGLIELGDGTKAFDKLPAQARIGITQSITSGAGEYFFCNASVRRTARRCAQGAQRQTGGLPVSRRLLINSAPAFPGLVLLLFGEAF